MYLHIFLLFLLPVFNLDVKFRNKACGEGAGHPRLHLGALFRGVFFCFVFLVIFTARLATFGPFLAKNTAKFVFRGRSDTVSLSLPL